MLINKQQITFTNAKRSECKAKVYSLDDTHDDNGQRQIYIYFNIIMTYAIFFILVLVHVQSVSGETMEEGWEVKMQAKQRLLCGARFQCVSSQNI